MAIATVVFWIGRKRFAHVPAGGTGFLKEVFSKEGMVAMFKLAPVYLFVAVFWALFDQTGSTWIFQSQDMDRNFLGFNWLPSQIQSLNSVFILTFIPIFAFFIYPAVQKFWPLSPLRKIGIGLLLMTAAFVLVSLIQVRIDAGGRPSISWQIAAFALLSAAEIMVSIVALEFAYTQSPKTMKSFIMCFFLAAVALGNFLVAGVNHYIRIPSAADEQLAEAIIRLPVDWQKDPRTVVLPGYVNSDTEGVFVRRMDKEAEVPLEVPGQEALDQAADIIIAAAAETNAFPSTASGAEIITDLKDHWGKPLKYLVLNSTTVRIWSPGADGKWSTKWDVGIIIEKPAPEPESKPSWLDKLRPTQTWLSQRKTELGIKPESTDGREGESFKITTFSGGQLRLHGAAYFWFFSALMGATATSHKPQATSHKPQATSHKPQATSHKPQATSHKPQATSHKPQATSHKPQATSHKPQATSHKPQATSHKPQATSHKPQATSHKPQATSHKPQATSHKPHASVLEKRTPPTQVSH